jgi:hypothetical protein
MASPGPNPLSYNAWVQAVGTLAVEKVQEVGGVYEFVSEPLQDVVTSILNYAELRIQRDLDFLSSQSSNTYTLNPGQQQFTIPFADFFTVQTMEIVQSNGGTVANSTPLLPVSKEFIQNVYGGLSRAGTPRYFAMYGDDFGNNQVTSNNVIFGPPPSFGFQLRVTGTQRTPSLFNYATTGIADTGYTYISTYVPDMLVIASMIMVSAYQRNWGGTSDDSPMGQSYEKQYQVLRIGAIPEENRRKLEGSAWSAYSTPTAATPAR